MFKLVKYSKEFKYHVYKNNVELGMENPVQIAPFCQV